jgi:hypothetical protein
LLNTDFNVDMWLRVITPCCDGEFAADVADSHDAASNPTAAAATMTVSRSLTGRAQVGGITVPPVTSSMAPPRRVRERGFHAVMASVLKT